MNIFRDFFEQYRRPFGQLDPHEIPQDILNDLYGNQQDQTERPGQIFDESLGPPNDFMSEVEEMFKDFFKNFTVFTPFPSFGGTQVLSPEEHNESSESGKSLQERMLKDNKTEQRERRPSSMFPFAFNDSRRLGGNETFENPTLKTREDKDLDEDLKNGDKSIDDIILPRGQPPETNQEPTSSFFFSSSLVTRNRDGVVETKKTTKDSSGNQEVTITRRDIGGKEYTITQKTDEYGNEETIDDRSYTGRNQHDLLRRSPEEPQLSLYDRIRHWFKGNND